MRFLCLFLILAPAFAAQPQLVWNGEVDGIVVLRIQKKRVTVDDGGGRIVGRPASRFAEPLPEQRQTVRVEVLEGRGSVQILEQPRADNMYSLAVGIEDRQPGSAPYSLAFYWDAAEGSAELKILKASRRETLTWKGRAEGEVVVNCRGNSCEAATTGGVPVRGGRARFSKPLPSRNTTVMLLESSGRGDLRLVEQPVESNGYTARVLIRDPHAGSSEYSFKLAWLQPKGEVLQVAQPGLYWAGGVEGTARVTVHSRAAMVSGSVTGARAQFKQSLSGAADVEVSKLRGRGRIQVIERPAKENDWTLVFEVADGGPGSDQYEIEVRW